MKANDNNINCHQLVIMPNITINDVRRLHCINETHGETMAAAEIMLTRDFNGGCNIMPGILAARNILKRIILAQQ